MCIEKYQLEQCSKYRVSQKTARLLIDCNLTFNSPKLLSDGSFWISWNKVEVGISNWVWIMTCLIDASLVCTWWARGLLSSKDYRSISSSLWPGSRMLKLEIGILPSFTCTFSFLAQIWSKYWNRKIKCFLLRSLQFWCFFDSGHAQNRWFVQEEKASWSFDSLFGFIIVRYN